MKLKKAQSGKKKTTKTRTSVKKTAPKSIAKGNNGRYSRGRSRPRQEAVVTPQRAEEPPVILTWQERFLNALKKSANVYRSCLEAGVTRKTAYAHKKQDEEFALAWDEAIEDAVDTLEDEAWRRAYSGVERRVGHYYQGTRVGEDVITEYSDQLMTTLLRAHRPRKFRETVTNFTLDMSKLNNEQLERISAGEDPAAVLNSTTGSSGAGITEAPGTH